MSENLSDLVNAVNARLFGGEPSSASPEVPSVNDEFFQVVRQPLADLGDLTNAVNRRLGAEGHPGFSNPIEAKTLEV